MNETKMGHVPIVAGLVQKMAWQLVADFPAFDGVVLQPVRFSFSLHSADFVNQ
jgi:hypothetical protein